MRRESLAHPLHAFDLCRLLREVVEFISIGAQIVEEFFAAFPYDVAKGIGAQAVTA
jgi:butyrate kinase